MENIGYLTFIELVLRGRIRGQDLFRLCNSSKKFQEYSNRSFQLINSHGQNYDNSQDQYLFRLLLKEMKVDKLWKSPREIYLEKTKGGTVWILCHDDGPRLKELSEYKLVKLPLMNIVEVCGGGSDNSLCLDNEGKVFVFNYRNLLVFPEIPSIRLVTNLPVIVQIAVGSRHCLCLDQQGKVWCFGSNSKGQLGLNGIEETDIPIINPYLSEIIKISANCGTSLCLNKNERVWCMGNNTSGQLGLGYEEYDDIIHEDLNPRPVLNPDLKEIVEISVGAEHCLCLDRDGKVWAFGSNYKRQLGFDENLDQTFPIIIPDLPKIVQISAGEDHSLCLTDDGKIWFIGSHLPRRLLEMKDKYPNQRYLYSEVKDVIQIQCGYEQSYYVDKTGTARNFGKKPKKISKINNREGKEYLTMPETIPHLSNVIMVSSDFAHTMMIKN